jgi:hypothetical protein
MRSFKLSGTDTLMRAIAATPSRWIMRIFEEKEIYCAFLEQKKNIYEPLAGQAIRRSVLVWLGIPEKDFRPCNAQS